MRGGMSHACETLEQGGFLACRQRPAVKCSLLVRYSAKTGTRYSSGLLQGSLLNRSGEWGPFCSREGNREVLPGLDLDNFPKRTVSGPVKKTWSKGLTQKVREGTWPEKEIMILS